jgi:hypothetical protein
MKPLGFYELDLTYCLPYVNRVSPPCILADVRAIAEMGASVISARITHSGPALDMSLDVEG